MTKKIVHIIIGLNIGGAELMLKRLVLNSSKLEHFEHSVISLTDQGIIGSELQEQGIKVYSLGMNSLHNIPLTMFKLRRLLKKINPDVVQTWMYHADLLGGLTAKSLGIKKIIWGIRTTDVSQGKSKLTIHLSKLCAKLSYVIPDSIICAAYASMEHHIRIGYDETKMTVIPNGYHLDTLRANQEDGNKIRQQNGLTEKDIVVGSIGRFNPIKNQKLFIETAAKLVKENPQIKFIMVGRDITKNNEELMSWINEYGMEENFRLLGQRSDIPQCLKAMNVFCLHSKTEGFPNILVEAIASGTPCVSVDVGDAKYILRDNRYIVPKNDSEQLKLCIQDIIISKSTNEENSNKDDCQSISYLYSEFDIDVISNKYASIWNS